LASIAGVGGFRYDVAFVRQLILKNSAIFLEALIRACSSDRNVWIGKER
jgi:hypothetical protein